MPIQSLPTFERLARPDHQQEHASLWDKHGKLIVQRSGDVDSVAFDPADLEKAIGGTLTHNHPKALPFSSADLGLAAEYGLILRAIGEDEYGRQWDYSLKFTHPSEGLAVRLMTAFEKELKKSEAELARAPLTDRGWQRESRHVALCRLADDFGFLYQRIQAHAPLSEVTRHERKRLSVLAHAENAIQDEWLLPLADSLSRIVARHTDEKGVVPVNRLEMLQREASAIVQRSFLGSPMPDGSLAPYAVRHGIVMANSAFFRMLWGLMIKAATAAVERHADIMRKKMPADLVRQFEMATINPFEREVQEIGDFNPLHLWLGPDGKNLLDRIWNAAGDMSGRVRQYLIATVTRGLPSSQIQQDLIRFLTPGKASSFLGSNGSWYAMRLARTEISAAYFRADGMAAQLDPMIESYTPYTAPQHACCDGCDDQQAGGPYPKTDLSHLPPFHANCICGVIWHLVEDVAGVIERLRQAIQDAISAARRSFADLIGPLSKRFIEMLFRGGQ